MLLVEFFLNKFPANYDAEGKSWQGEYMGNLVSCQRGWQPRLKNSEIVLKMLRHSNQDLGQTVLMITQSEPRLTGTGFFLRDGEIVSPGRDSQWHLRH